MDKILHNINSGYAGETAANHSSSSSVSSSSLAEFRARLEITRPKTQRGLAARKVSINSQLSTISERSSRQSINSNQTCRIDVCHIQIPSKPNDNNLGKEHCKFVNDTKTLQAVVNKSKPVKEVTVLSKTTTDEDSNTDVINDTPFITTSHFYDTKKYTSSKVNTKNNFPSSHLEAKAGTLNTIGKEKSDFCLISSTKLKKETKITDPCGETDKTAHNQTNIKLKRKLYSSNNTMVYSKNVTNDSDASIDLNPPQTTTGGEKSKNVGKPHRSNFNSLTKNKKSDVYEFSSEGSSPEFKKSKLRVSLRQKVQKAKKVAATNKRTSNKASKIAKTKNVNINRQKVTQNKKNTSAKSKSTAVQDETMREAIVSDVLNTSFKAQLPEIDEALNFKSKTPLQPEYIEPRLRRKYNKCTVGDGENVKAKDKANTSKATKSNNIVNKNISADAGSSSPLPELIVENLPQRNANDSSFIDLEQALIINEPVPAKRFKRRASCFYSHPETLIQATKNNVPDGEKRQSDNNLDTGKKYVKVSLRRLTDSFIAANVTNIDKSFQQKSPPENNRRESTNNDSIQNNGDRDNIAEFNVQEMQVDSELIQTSNIVGMESRPSIESDSSVDSWIQAVPQSKANELPLIKDMVQNLLQIFDKKMEEINENIGNTLKTIIDTCQTKQQKHTQKLLDRLSSINAEFVRRSNALLEEENKRRALVATVKEDIQNVLNKLNDLENM